MGDRRRLQCDIPGRGPRAVIFRAAAALSQRALADATWIGTSGWWSDPINWDSGWVPGDSEIAHLVQSGTDTVTVTFDDTAGSFNLAALITDYTGGTNGGSIAFTQVSNSFSTT